MPRDYSSWITSKDISIVDMELDTKNPRMPDDLNIKQTAVIAIMEKKYNVIDIARSIGIHGYMPRENIIITYENNKPVVLEGNRRITALKLIYDPSLSSENSGEYLKIKNQFEDVSKILYPAVLIAPSRREADPIIIDKHTENTEIPWKPIIQARLYKRKKEEYHSISNAELALELGTTEIKIVDSFRRLVLYDEAIMASKGMYFSKKVEDPEIFEITTLERIMNSSEVQAKLHFTISESKIETKNLDRFRAVLKFIVLWMFEAPGEKDYQKITSRTANTSVQIMRYINLAIKKAKNTENDDEEINTNDIEKNDGVMNNCDPESDIKETKSEFSRRKVRKPASINDLPIQFDKLVMGTGDVRLYDEMRSLKFSDSPITIAILIRVFFERAVRRFCDLKKIKSFNKTENGENKNVKIGDATFKEILEYIEKNSEELSIDYEIRRSIGRFSVANYKELVSLSTLNNLVHYCGRVIGREKVIDLWTELAPVIEFFVTDHKIDTDDSTKI